MKRVLIILGVVLFTLPLWLIGGMYVWLYFLARGKMQAANFGMKLSAEKQFALDLSQFIEAFFIPISIVLLMLCWGLAAWLGYRAFRRRSPEARG